MKNKYFDKCETLEELKKEYRRLAMIYHPDKGGELRTMQEINTMYALYFEKLKNIRRAASGETYSKETNETPNEFMEIINELIHFENITLEICGAWLWITGETKPIKDKLKELKFRWSSNKEAWYYHKEPFRKKSKKDLSLDDIRNMFGSEKINAYDKRKLIEA